MSDDVELARIPVIQQLAEAGFVSSDVVIAFQSEKDPRSNSPDADQRLIASTVHRSLHESPELDLNSGPFGQRGDLNGTAGGGVGCEKFRIDGVHGLEILEIR